MKNLVITFILCGIAVLINGCSFHTFYRSIFVDSEVKIMTTNILNKNVQINKYLYDYKRYHTTIVLQKSEKDIERQLQSNFLQTIIDKLKEDDIIDISYQYKISNYDQSKQYYESIITYKENEKQKHIKMLFVKYGNDDYYLVEAGLDFNDIEDFNNTP